MKKFVVGVIVTIVVALVLAWMNRVELMLAFVRYSSAVDVTPATAVRLPDAGNSPVTAVEPRISPPGDALVWRLA